MPLDVPFLPLQLNLVRLSLYRSSLKSLWVQSTAPVLRYSTTPEEERGVNSKYAVKSALFVQSTVPLNANAAVPVLITQLVIAYHVYVDIHHETDDLLTITELMLAVLLAE